MTKFCTETIAVEGLPLTIDGNTKIGGWPDPIPNALSLPAPACCPGSTEVCRSTCYASWQGSKLPQALRDRYEANEATIREILAQPDAGYTAAMQLARWIAAHCRDVGFRWHVSGDVFSDQYAWWIVAVCLGSPEVLHWIYTRTMQAVPILCHAHNLASNVSADRANYRRALEVAQCYDCRLTYLWQGEDLPELPSGSVVFPDYPQRRASGRVDLPRGIKPMLCPADYFGQSERQRCGVCTQCGNPKHARAGQ